MSKVLPIILIISALYLLFFNALVYFKNKKNKFFSLFGISIFLWLACFSAAYLSADPDAKVFYFKLGYIGVTFIPINFYFFVRNFLGKKEKFFSIIGYGVAFLFILISFLFDGLISGLYYYSWGQYPRVNIHAHIFFLVYFISYFSVAIYHLIRSLISNKNNIQGTRIKYVLLASILGSMGAIDYLPNYGIDIFPFGFLFMVSFPLIVIYAILRYRLWDITLVLTRTGIFIGIYSVVLGIPLILAFGFQDQLIDNFAQDWWIIPLISSTILAIAGPFIYIFVQKKADDKLFEDQRRYQTTLRQASIGMGRIKDLKRLVNLIVHIVTRAVRVEYSIVYLLNKKLENYELGSCRSRHLDFTAKKALTKNSVLVSHLKAHHTPIIYEEIKQKTEDYKDPSLRRMEEELRNMKAELIIPSFVDENLLGVLVLGKKVSNQPFSDSDLSVFTILANQAALAIENAMFYEDMRETHEQLFKAEKMATIGTMADGLSHQINNRLHALGFIAGDLLDTIKMKKNKAMPPEVKEMMIDIEHGLNRIQENVTQGGEIVQGLLKYTRKGKEGFEKVDLDELIDASIEMTQFKIKTGEMDIIREYDRKLPKIKGNFTQLQEVFFNMIDNAYDAMTQRKTELKEEGYKPTIRISAESAGDGKINIFLKDNGVGVKDEDKEKLFTPFFTTKLSSKKGTGLGLYVIQKLIEENHGGKVVYRSKYMEGTAVQITLPIYH